MDWYDEVDLEDMEFDKRSEVFHHPCPCGDRFEIPLSALLNSETDIAVCPSCGLSVKVQYQQSDLESFFTSNPGLMPSGITV
ncbi:diphthamide biosynthesis protein 3 [Trichomonascus vanleenenianus]|uniref:Kti11p n=1 Tax=Trichomonascus vanleenenianus TaxID=2268995 RepID=UPI003ECB36EB